MMVDKCVNTKAPIEFCLYCGKEVRTCERDNPENNSYLCPVHPNGFEDKYGNWFCNDICYKEAERIKKKLEEITPSNEELLKMVKDQYKSVTELCAENPNLLEYIEQLEKEVDKLNSLKISIEKLLFLHHKLVLRKGESEEADKIRDELDELAKHIPEEQEWMRKLSASLYDLIENNHSRGTIKMNFLSTFIKCFATSAAVFLLFVSVIGPLLAKTFNWHGDDPTALFGPEWIWNYAFILSVVSFFASAFLFEK